MVLESEIKSIQLNFKISYIVTFTLKNLDLPFCNSEWQNNLYDLMFLYLLTDFGLPDSYSTHGGKTNVLLSPFANPNAPKN